jgi:hypothetical protein
MQHTNGISSAMIPEAFSHFMHKNEPPADYSLVLEVSKVDTTSKGSQLQVLCN